MSEKVTGISFDFVQSRGWTHSERAKSRRCYMLQFLVSIALLHCPVFF